MTSLSRNLVFMAMSGDEDYYHTMQDHVTNPDTTSLGADRRTNDIRCHEFGQKVCLVSYRIHNSYIV